MQKESRADSFVWAKEGGDPCLLTSFSLFLVPVTRKFLHLGTLASRRYVSCPKEFVLDMFYFAIQVEVARFSEILNPKGDIFI
jgi:hypothetical protein